MNGLSIQMLNFAERSAQTLRLLKIFMFGSAGSGKDTVADIMAERYDIVSTALADPIRTEYERFTGRTDHKQNRGLMIDIGQTYKRLYGQDVWCRETLDTVNKLVCGRSHPPLGVLIRDGRYDHEYEFWVRAHGYTPVRLTADADIRLARLIARDGKTQADALAYETAHFIDESAFAYELRNNGTLADLRDNVDALIAQLRKHD